MNLQQARLRRRGYEMSTLGGASVICLGLVGLSTATPTCYTAYSSFPSSDSSPAAFKTGEEGGSFLAMAVSECRGLFVCVCVPNVQPKSLT